jgi:hypothetical protein
MVKTHPVMQILNHNREVSKMEWTGILNPAQGDWYPANNGTETPFVSRNGKRLLYVWQPRTGKHAYLDLGSDVILTEDEAQSALQL